MSSLLKAMANLARPISAALEAGPDAAVDTRPVRDAMTMYVLLLNWAAVAGEQLAARPGSKAAAASVRGSRWSPMTHLFLIAHWLRWQAKGKAASSTWDDFRASCAGTVLVLLEQHVHQLWPMACPSEEFTGFVAVYYARSIVGKLFTPCRQSSFPHAVYIFGDSRRDQR